MSTPNQTPSNPSQTDQGPTSKTVSARLALTILISLALIVGWILGALFTSVPPLEGKQSAPQNISDPHAGHSHGSVAGASDDSTPAGRATWTCSMHPQVRLPEPGACPICGMDLIAASASGIQSPDAVTMSAEARVLAGIETTLVTSQPLTRRIALTGEVVADETRVSRVAAWFGGRIETMHVDFVGAAVAKGDPMFTIYSPELLVAQRELLEAARRVKQASGDALASVAIRTLAASKERLRLWGLRQWQVKRVLTRGKASPTTTVFAPRDGVVIRRQGLVGSYVETGSVVYELADLSRVWLALSAFDQDLPWLAVGQAVQIDVPDGRPQRQGMISFIAPTVERRTRATQVRVAVDNSSGDLRPGAWVRAHIQSPWSGGEHALVIPASAPLIGRDRAVVFVSDSGSKQPTYLLREVVLGPLVTGAQGDVYVVREGLMAGESVVSEGAFKLDSSLQIRGDRSLATLLSEDSTEANAHQPTVTGYIDGPRSVPFVAALGEVIDAAIVVSKALGDDAIEASRSTIPALVASVHRLLAIDGDHIPLDLGNTVQALSNSADADLAAIREAYVPVSLAIALLVQSHRKAVEKTSDFQLTHCPMAGPDGSGAVWLQAPGTVHNPYYGEQMLRCGAPAQTVPNALFSPLDEAPLPLVPSKGNTPGETL